MKEKKNFATFLGKFVGNSILVALSTIIMAVLVSITWVFVRWILGVVM